jgi:hypothetical protein
MNIPSDWRTAIIDTIISRNAISTRMDIRKGQGQLRPSEPRNRRRAFGQMAGLARIWRRSFRTPKIPHFRGRPMQ